MDNNPADPNNESVPPHIINPSNQTKNRTLLLLLPLILFIALISVSVWGYLQYKDASKANKDVLKLTAENKAIADELSKRKTTTGEENIDKSTYQSVFLSNGQTYFGKITKITDSQITLEDIYYLKTDNPNVELVKLGNELHGPQDKMYIERKEVQFWENLKQSSKVSQAIKQYQLQHPI